ncbi:MAG TPA: CotH kinase family protein [Thermoanaerobaculia bacterium]|nr:CotH kinase family protein [Thermoanaerobaculia bacterium]
MRRTIVSLFFLIALPAFAADPSVDALFDQSVVHDVRIAMSAADWSTLRATYQENTNYDAELTIDGQVVPNSSIRSRGSGTRNGIKPGLRVDFNRRDKAQTFRGFKVLVLDNMYNDASFIRERLAFSVFEEMGITAPRNAYATLTMNGEPWGLYAIVEPIDKIFVTNHVDGGGGNLFEYNVPATLTQPAWDFSLSRGTTVADYVPSPFEPKTNESSLDGTALLAFIRTVSEAPDATFVSDIAKFIDSHVLLTYYAIEVATSEVDGLTSFFGVNNFYLYQREGSQRFEFLPWDHDFNFVGPEHDVFHGVERNQLIRRLLNDAQLKAFYLATLQQVLARFVNTSWMMPRIDALATQIREHVLRDTKRRGGNDPAVASHNFDDELVIVHGTVIGRAQDVVRQLQSGRRILRR